MQLIHVKVAPLLFALGSFFRFVGRIMGQISQDNLPSNGKAI